MARTSPGPGTAPAVVQWANGSSRGAPAQAEEWVSTHFGQLPSDPGGVSAVLSTYLTFQKYGHRVTVVPTYSSAARLWGLWPYLRALRVLLTTSERKLGIVHVHVSQRGSFVREGSLCLLAHWRGLPTCVTVHGSVFGVHFASHKWLYVPVLKRADRVVVLTDEARGLLQTVLPFGSLRTLRNPVDLPSHVEPASQTAPVALFAGLLSRRKGLDVLLKAWPSVRSRVPTARLFIAGPPHDVVIAVPNDGSVEYVGCLRRAEIRRVIDRARVAVLPSRNEAMPVFILEAMAAARPVTSTTVAAVPETVGCGGIIVPPGDVDALASALVRVLGDAGEAERLGSAGRRLVEARHSPAVVARQLAELYRELSPAPPMRGDGRPGIPSQRHPGPAGQSVA